MSNKICPRCGYCETCGRGGHQLIPYYPYYPYWYQSGVSAGGAGITGPYLGDITQGTSTAGGGGGYTLAGSTFNN